MVGDTGVMLMVFRSALVTWISVDPETPLNEAETKVVPLPSPDASPSLPLELLMLAMLPSSVDQVTRAVRFWVELSEYLPVAWNGCVVPLAIEVLVGVTSISLRLASVIVKSVWPNLPFSVAVMVVGPDLTEVASPLLPGAVLMVATVSSDEVQFTTAVRSCVDWWE